MFNKILNLGWVILFFSFCSLADEVYNVKAVKISASDKNSSIARNIAIERGQIKAFEILVKRHFPTADINSFKTDDILNTVAGFELSEERISSTNYSAKINVKFSKAYLDKLMKEAGAKFQKDSLASSEKKPIKTQENTSQLQTIPKNIAKPTLVTLIVPIVEVNNKTYWFEEENNWLEFWHKKITSNKLQSQFILPIGDLEDLSFLNKSIINKNIYDLTEIFDKYNVNNIALIKLGDLSNSPYNLTLQVNYMNKYNPIWQQHSFNVMSGDSLKVLFNQAFIEVLNFNFITDSSEIAKGNKFNITRPNVITVDYSTSNFSDWVYLENIVSKSEYIRNFTLLSMSLNQYKFSFEYEISFADLQEWFQNHRFSLEDLGNKRFILTRDALSAEY